MLLAPPRSMEELLAHLDEVRASPLIDGRLDFLLSRPAEGEREVLTHAELDVSRGLVGDDWETRPCRLTPDKSPHPDMQLNIVNARFSAFLAEDPLLRAGTGDQLHVDLDLSPDNLPPGTRLSIGDDGALVEVTAVPHRGCAKFVRRYGGDAMRIVNDPVGRALNLRGVCARVVWGGTVRLGDRVTRLG
ncbi:MAG TPA: hypothetical protein VFG97_01830 [Pedococcus sp.]|nr:hypothetical protein [Pedococcus sp.]